MTDVTGEELQALIEMFGESDWKSLSLQLEDFRIFLSRDADHVVPAWLAQGRAETGGDTAKHAATGPALADAAHPPVARPVAESGAAPTAAGEPEGAVVIRAPNLGIFYRAPKPGAPPYVEVGDQVEADTEICLIEVMKLFTPVTAGVKGVVAGICVADGEMIEHGQPLFYIQPEQ